jgi:hypothetical protein
VRHGSWRFLAFVSVSPSEHPFTASTFDAFLIHYSLSFFSKDLSLMVHTFNRSVYRDEEFKPVVVKVPTIPLYTLVQKKMGFSQ